MLTLRQIEVFRAVMRAGTLVGAARELGIAQPTATRTLRRVEDVVGLPLFDRSHGRLSPTAEAHRILEETDRAFEALRLAVGRAAHAARAGARSFCVGTSPSLGRALVPEALARLAGAHPDLSLQLDVLSVSQIPAYLTEGPGEVAVTLFPLRQSGILSERVGEGDLVALIPRAWPLATAARVAPADLAGLPLAVFEAQSVHGQAIDAFLAETGAAPGRTHLVRFAESAAALAEAGLALALVDAFSAMSVRREKVVVRPTTARRRFEVYLHRVLGRQQARFTLPFRDLLGEGIRRLAEETMP